MPFQQKSANTSNSHTKSVRSRDVRYSAVEALRQIGKPSKDAIPALIHALGDENVWTANSAADALGQIGEPAVPALGTS